MPPLLKDALGQQSAAVRWQTGTVEAVRAAGGDVIPIDPQFSRFLRSNTDVDP